MMMITCLEAVNSKCSLFLKLHVGCCQKEVTSAISSFKDSLGWRDAYLIHVTSVLLLVFRG